MRFLFHLAGMALYAGAVSLAHAGEAWQPVYEDEAVRVSIDSASISRNGQIVMFRERHALARAEIDQTSLRRIVEIQIRRAVDCRKRRFAIQSKAMFTEQDSMVRYEASRPEKPNWQPPQNEQEVRVYEWVCVSRSR
ncbi:MAG: hypothetical protein HXY27_05670 [Hydrogenophilaceae bacterium]|nr:hypothetical protein [Hydrogenophilaceae bacterium]